MQSASFRRGLIFSNCFQWEVRGRRVGALLGGLFGLTKLWRQLSRSRPFLPEPGPADIVTSLLYYHLGRCWLSGHLAFQYLVTYLELHKHSQALLVTQPPGVHQVPAWKSFHHRVSMFCLLTGEGRVILFYRFGGRRSPKLLYSVPAWQRLCEGHKAMTSSGASLGPLYGRGLCWASQNIWGSTKRYTTGTI